MPVSLVKILDYRSFCPKPLSFFPIPNKMVQKWGYIGHKRTRSARTRQRGHAGPRRRHSRRSPGDSASVARSTDLQALLALPLRGPELPHPQRDVSEVWVHRTQARARQSLLRLSIRKLGILDRLHPLRFCQRGASDRSAGAVTKAPKICRRCHKGPKGPAALGIGTRQLCLGWLGSTFGVTLITTLISHDGLATLGIGTRKPSR